MMMLNVLIWLALLATPFATTAWERGKVERFATLPVGEAHPEGITTDRDGNVYVVTVAANKPATSEGTLLVFDPQGKHLRMSASRARAGYCSTSLPSTDG